MKCDELKAYNVVATADVNPEVVDSLGCTEWAGYDKDEVDAAIAELKAEINRKEAVGQRWFVRCMEARAENVRLKRALWLARKAHAVAMFSYWDSHYRDNPNAVYRNRTVDWLRNRWLLILDAIIKKEKEYK